MIKKITYLLENWKMIIHLIFKTKHFGVNNLPWSSHPSVFGSTFPPGVFRVLKNYRMIKIRAFSGFIPLNDAIEMFPLHARKHGYKPIPPMAGETGQHQK